MPRTTVATVFFYLSLPVTVAFGTESSVPFINADDVHAQGITGKGVTVVVIDDGVDFGNHGIVGDSIGGFSMVGGQYIADGGAALPGFTHGTYMALIITDATGVAPDADILSVRVFGPDGSGNPLDTLLALARLKFLRRADSSIRVVNLSIGAGEFICSCDAEAQVYADLIFELALEGVITFAATGNDAFCGAIYAPACVSSAVRVAANYDAFYGSPTFFDPPGCGDISPDPRWVTCFSNITEDCNYLIAAPGYDITVGSFNGHGTSQATAHCSGVAALMFEKNACGSLGAFEARDIIFNTATIMKWAFPFCPLPPEPRHINALAAVNSVTMGPCATVAGDMDCDNTVSLADFRQFGQCMSGPGMGPLLGSCECADLPSSPPDGDVDLQDFATFQNAFTGWGEGACCHLDGSCTEGPVDECVSDPGALYQGHDTTCAMVQCPEPSTGACCDVSGTSCTEMSPVDCGFNDGLYFGGGTQCADVDCPTVRYRNVLDPLRGFVSAGAGLALGDDIVLSGAGGGDMVYYDLNVYGGNMGAGSFDVTVSLYNAFPGSGGTPIAGTQRTFTNLPDAGSPVFISAVFDPPISVPNQFWIVAEFSNSTAGWFSAGAAEIGSTANSFGRNVPPWMLFWFGGNPYASLWANVAFAD